MISFEGLFCTTPNNDTNHRSETNLSNNHHKRRSELQPSCYEETTKKVSSEQKGSSSTSSNNTFMRSVLDAKMLSFSSSSSAAKNGGGGGLFDDDHRDNSSPDNFLYPFNLGPQLQPPAHSKRIPGYGANKPISRYKGPFTPSQWMELEHQALIYKHFVANIPVPPHLLTHIRKSFNPFLFSGSPFSGSYPPNPFGWGPFHLGYSGNADPEPGRCRRTDGKKWRCSRDAMPDHKYCDRHINRNRHRSRKPVEGQNGHSVSGPRSSKMGPVASSSSVPMISANSSGAVQLTNANTSSQTLVSRTQESEMLSVKSPTSNMKSVDSLFPITRQHFSIMKPVGSDGGPLSSSPLLYASQKDSYMYPAIGDSFLDSNEQGSHIRNPLCHFTEDWTKDPSNTSSVTLPQELESDWTQLSMSIPMASSDFSSSSNSPIGEKLDFTPLGLPHEFEPAQTSSCPQKQAADWIPISWKNSFGGPLGEALNTTSSIVGNYGIAPETGRIMESCDGSYLHSPTGVLQKSMFVSLSNTSSSANSPRASAPSL